ncbi:MAG: Tfx family DNA-binding protein [Nitrososphaerota archaeon]
MTRKKIIKPFLTKRQIDVLRLRMAGLTQDQVAERLNTSRENITNLEARAYLNIMRSRLTLRILEELNPSNEVLIPTGIPLTDIPRIILDRADLLGIKLVIGAETLYQLLKGKTKSRSGHLIAPIKIRILPTGEIKIIS